MHEIDATQVRDVALRFALLLAQYEGGRHSHRVKLHELCVANPSLFLGMAARHLQTCIHSAALPERQPGAEVPPPGAVALHSRATEELASMVVGEPLLVNLLTSPVSMSASEALTILRSVVGVAPGAEGKLIAGYLGISLQDAQLPAFFRVLDLIAGTGAVGRNTMQITQLLRSDNRKVRARVAALLLGFTGRIDTTLRLLEDEDSRVQATAIESLWPSAASSGAQRVFREFSQSNVVRVATNALVGLHLAGNSTAAAALKRNLEGPDEAMALGAAWAMGFLGDHQFRAPLERCLRSGSSPRRGACLRALVKLRKRQAEPDDTLDLAAPLEPFPLEMLKRGAQAWNQWRAQEFHTAPELDGTDLTGMEISGADLSFCSLRDANLTSAALQVCSLFGADLRGATFTAARLNRCDLRAAEVDSDTSLHGACLEGCTLYGLDLQLPDCTRLRLRDCDITNAEVESCAEPPAAS